jgi:hypothetical protein
MHCFVGEAKFAASIAAPVGERIKALAAADFGLGKVDAADQADLRCVVQLLVFSAAKILRLAELVSGMHSAKWKSSDGTNA